MARPREDFNLLRENELDVLGREFYTYFKENKRFNSKITDDYFKWRKVLASLVNYMGTMTRVGSKGFYIKNIGYFHYEPLSDVLKRTKYIKTKISTKYYLNFTPDKETIRNWYTETIENIKEDKTKDLESLKNIKLQSENGIRVNKRSVSRHKK